MAESDTMTSRHVPTKWGRFHLRTLLLAVTVLCACFAIVRYRLDAEAARNRDFRVHLERGRVEGIVAYIEAFSFNHGKFPSTSFTAGTHWPRSWRCEIHRRYMMPQFFPRNTTWDDVLRLPNSHAEALRDSDAYSWSVIYPETATNHLTNVFAVVGADTAIADTPQYKFEDVDADTILIVQVSQSISVPWCDPGDFEIDRVTDPLVTCGELGLGRNDENGFWVGFADRSVWLLDRKMPFAELRKLCSVTGAKKYDRSDVFADYVLIKDDPHLKGKGSN